MPSVVLYGTRFCPYCVGARLFLRQRGVAFEDIAVDGNTALRREVEARSGRDTVPQIWIDDYHVGGFTDLLALEREGVLDELLSPSDAVARNTSGEPNA
ncbi:MAG: glutaredoxin 3 [Gammaproteobacteria bacterium]|jgi:glutaredoxin 3|nr:glutaredoxin 3 [Gammaproteobacteria bacterium]MBK8133355.1 glutaredoxin 3 [Gammaproteobacteria bacterium]MBK9426163.1 glutaredoxin 3 [Gammaproteobacteria bacterium]